MDFIEGRVSEALLNTQSTAAELRHRAARADRHAEILGRKAALAKLPAFRKMLDSARVFILAYVGLPTCAQAQLCAYVERIAKSDFRTVSLNEFVNSEGFISQDDIATFPRDLQPVVQALPLLPSDVSALFTLLLRPWILESFEA